MNIDAHKARMMANGSSTGESLGNSTKNSINHLFKDSPFYRIVKINGIDTEVRITERAGLVNIKSSQHKLLTFRPDTKIDVGAIVEFDGSQWLNLDFTNNDVFPLATIQKCNEDLRWHDSIGQFQSVPCIVNKSPMDRIFVKSNSHDVHVVDQMMYVLAKYDDLSKTIKSGQRFILGNQAYSVNGVDDLSYVHNEVGVIQLIVKVDQIKDTDDMINKIADNNTSTSTTDSGGDLW